MKNRSLSSVVDTLRSLSSIDTPALASPFVSGANQSYLTLQHRVVCNRFVPMIMFHSSFDEPANHFMPLTCRSKPARWFVSISMLPMFITARNMSMIDETSIRACLKPVVAAVSGNYECNRFRIMSTKGSGARGRGILSSRVSLKG